MTSLVFTLLAGALAVAAPAPSLLGGEAPPARVAAAADVEGRVVDYVLDRDGRPIAFVLAGGTRVYFSAQLAEELRRRVRPGDRIRAFGERDRDGSLRAVAIQNLDTGYLIEEAPPLRDRRAEDRRVADRRADDRRADDRRADDRRADDRRVEDRRTERAPRSLAEASAVTLRIADVERSRSGRLQRLVLADGTTVQVPGRLRNALEARGIDLRRGDRVRAELRRSRSGRLHLERVWIDGRPVEEARRRGRR